MRKKTIQLVTIIMIISIVLFIPNTIKAAKRLTVSVSNKNPEVGNTFTLTVGSGVGGRISMKSSNPSVVSVTETQSIKYDSETFTLTAKSAGTTTITVTAVDLATTDPVPVEVTGSKSVTITVKEKQKPATEPPSNSNNSNNNNNNSSNKTPASNKPNTNKDKVKDVKETEQEEEATPQFGMNSLMLTGVKENGEKQEIAFTPTFNIDTYEYTCNIASDIKDIEVATEAGEYNDYVKIEKPETFVEGENIIKITMSKDDQNLTYTIKVIKETSTEMVQEVENEEIKQQNNQSATITFTIPQFIGVIIAICLIEGVLLKMPWKKLCGKRKEKHVSNNM